MIDQEMFLQMMESIDKDGDGTVTKASHTSRTRTHALVAPHARMRERMWVASTRGPAARMWSSKRVRTVRGSAARPCVPPHACQGHRLALLVRRPRRGASCDQTAADERPAWSLVPAWWPVKATDPRSL